jgi:hypothetical protein
MAKTHKEPGLIRYDTEAGLDGKETKKLKPRSFIYLTALFIIFGILVYSVTDSGKLKATFIRGARTPYQQVQLTDGTNQVINLYRVRLDYKDKDELNIHFKIKEGELQNKITFATPKNPLSMMGGKSKSIIMHFKFDQSDLTNGNRIIILQFLDDDNRVLLEKEVKLVGPLS